MTLTIDLSPEIEVRLSELAAQSGLRVHDYVRRLIQQASDSHPQRKRGTLDLGGEERSRLLAAAAESAAPLYASDLARNSADRELTALTALDGEEFDDLPG